MMRLFDMMDEAIAQELGIDVETYIDIVENKCTDEEMLEIITAVLDEDKPRTEAAKKIVEKYL